MTRSLKEALAFVVLLCIASTCQGSVIHSLNRSWSISSDSEEYIVPGTLFFNDENTFPFGICKAKSEETANSERLCNVTLITPNKKDQHCKNIRVFAGKGRQLFLNGYMQLWPYSQNQVIVGWYEQTPENAKTKRSYYNIGILNMVDCTTKYLNFPTDKTGYGLFPSLLTYPNEVDVILYNKEKCKTDRCRLAYDLKGKQIGKPQVYSPEKIGYASPVSKDDPKKGFFVLVQELESATVILVDSKGNGKTLQIEDFENGITKQRIAFSNAHEIFSTCRLPVNPDKKPTIIYCSQFDSNGTLIFKSEITVSQTVGWVSIRNVRKGGLILATSACDDLSSENPGNCNKFNIYNVNKNGEQSYPKTINNFGQKCYEAPESKTDHTELGVHIYENDRREFCFDFSCLNSNTLKFISKCVTKKSIFKLNNWYGTPNINLGRQVS